MLFVHAINFTLVLFLWIFIWTLFNIISEKLSNSQLVLISIIGILAITYIMYVSPRFKL
jgi:hypothetical protein